MCIYQCLSFKDKGSVSVAAAIEIKVANFHSNKWLNGSDTAGIDCRCR
jgi:hypothetical protein